MIDLMGVGSGDVKVHFWVLDVFNVVRVYRDDVFLKNQFLMLDHVWSKICEYKNNYDLYKKEVMTSSSGASKRSASMSMMSNVAVAAAIQPTSSGVSGVADIDMIIDEPLPTRAATGCGTGGGEGYMFHDD